VDRLRELRGIGGRGAEKRGLARNAAAVEDRKDDQAAAKVRQIGSKTFYWKHERWTIQSVTRKRTRKAIV